MNETTYKYNIGDRIYDEYRDLTILDRKMEDKIYYYNRDGVRKSGYNHIAKYRVKCNKCGYDGSTYYRNGEEYEEYWMTQKSLSWNKSGCALCRNIPQITVVGINSIVDNSETQWMIPYFQVGYEEAKKYSPSSNQEKYFVCPDCGRIKDKLMKISSLNTYHSCNCICSDGVSYPNKYGYELFFNQLSNQIENCSREYQPNWAKPYYYDFYFEKDNKKYICEFDGGLGHGNEIHKASNKTIEETIATDKRKDNLAKEHNIEMIRIDATKSDSIFISSNILKSKLSSILDFSNVDFSKCDEFAHKNIIKTICFDYENNFLENFELSKKYNLHYDTIANYLKQGREIGWITRKRVIKRDPKQYLNRKTKKVSFTNNNGEIEIYNSIKELSKISLEKFGVFISESKLRSVCCGYCESTCGIKGFKYV